jgi:hypothetical protein
VQEALRTVYPAMTFPSVESVGPKVSGELIITALIAVGASLAAILIYIWLRFEWQFSVGAVAALVHDVILTIGVFSLLQIRFDLATIAALLTIIGYSINDTVVIFDRLRENLIKYKQRDLRDVMNLSRQRDAEPDIDDLGHDAPGADRASGAGRRRDPGLRLRDLLGRDRGHLFLDLRGQERGPDDRGEARLVQAVLRRGRGHAIRQYRCLTAGLARWSAGGPRPPLRLPRLAGGGAGLRLRGLRLGADLHAAGDAGPAAGRGVAAFSMSALASLVTVVPGAWGGGPARGGLMIGGLDPVHAAGGAGAALRARGGDPDRDRAVLTLADTRGTLAGWRVPVGRARARVGVGALSGLDGGSTGLNGPPVILFNLGTEGQPVAVTRGNLAVFLTLTSLLPAAALAAGLSCRRGASWLGRSCWCLTASAHGRAHARSGPAGLGSTAASPML